MSPPPATWRARSGSLAAITPRGAPGDADGSYTSPQDHLWIDLNDDGRWDPTAEQFLYAAILMIGPGRYAVRSDPAGTRLAFVPLEGTGTVRLTVRRPETREHLAETHAQFIGRDGSALNVDGSAEVTVPVGEYRISALSLVLSDPAGGPPWHYGFSALLRPAKADLAQDREIDCALSQNQQRS